MPVPDGALPPVFTGPLNPSSDICDAFTRLIGLREQLGILISWMFKDDGTINDGLNAELYKWIYGPLTASGTGGEYVLTSTLPYANPYTINYPGRIVFFIASHDSPDSSVGSTIKLYLIDPLPLLNLYGVSLEAGDIRNGQVVGAIFDGTNWRAFTSISRISLDQLEGGAEGDFLRSRDVGGKQHVVSEGYYRTPDDGLVAVPAAGSAATFSHGFSKKPLFYGVDLVCIATDLGYSAGTGPDDADEVQVAATSYFDSTFNDQNSPTISVSPTTIRMIQRPVGQPNALRIANKTTGAQSEIDPTKWKLRAWAVAR